MLEHIQHIQSGERVADRADTREEVPVKVTREQVVKEPEPAREQVFTEEPPYGEPGFEDGFEDNYDSFEESGYGGYEEDYGGYGEDYEIADEESALPEPEQPAEDERSLRLKAREFESLSDVTEFCAGQLGVPRPLAVTVVNKACSPGWRRNTGSCWRSNSSVSCLTRRRSKETDRPLRLSVLFVWSGL